MNVNRSVLALKHIDLAGWIKVVRIPFHTALVFPFLLGTVVAWSESHLLDWPVMIIGSIAVILATANCFMGNEYFDYETDLANRHYNRFTGGSRILPDERVPRDGVLKVAIVCGVAAIGLGIVLQFYFATGPLTLLLGVPAIAVGFFYTAKPIQLAYRGFGELFIGWGVGLMPILCGYYVQAHRLSIVPAIISLPWVIAVILLIWVNEFPDYESDMSSGKKNLVVRLGKDRAGVIYNGLTVLMWLLFIPTFIILPHLPLAAAALLVPVFILSGWNLVAVKRGEWRDQQGMEKICQRQIVYSVLMPLLMIGMFVWRGLVA